MPGCLLLPVAAILVFVAAPAVVPGRVLADQLKQPALSAVARLVLVLPLFVQLACRSHPAAPSRQSGRFRSLYRVGLHRWSCGPAGAYPYNRSGGIACAYF